MNFKKSYVEMIRYPYRFSVHCIDCKIAQCSQYKERQWHVFLMPNYVLHKSNMGYCSYLENLIKDEAEYHVRTLQRTVWFYLYTLDTGKVLKWNCQIMHMCNHVFQNTWALHVLHIKNKTKNRQCFINLSENYFLWSEKHRRKHRHYLIDNQSTSFGACDSEKNDYRFDKYRWGDYHCSVWRDFLI